MRDPLRPFNKRKELFVSCLTDVGHRVIWLQGTGGKSYGRFGSILGVPPCKKPLTPPSTTQYFLKPHLNQSL